MAFTGATASSCLTPKIIIAVIFEAITLQTIIYTKYLPSIFLPNFTRLWFIGDR
jgi:hypothetical protein